MTSTLTLMSVLLVLMTNAVRWPNCPTFCTCNSPDDNQLTINCRNPIHNNFSSDTTRDFDDLLSSEQAHSLKSLSISGSSMKSVPESVCSLTYLTSLRLDYNSLQQLPDGCLNKLTLLTQFTANNNAIRRLQDGLFDGLQNLVSVQIAYNQMESVGFRVFSNVSDLQNLRNIDLSHNSLTSIDSWPIIRGYHGNTNSLIRVELSHNRISTFTNFVGVSYRCGSRTFYLNLVLSNNKIRHLMDWFNGWGYRSIADLICSCYDKGTSNRVLEVSMDYNYIQCDCVDFDLIKTVVVTRGGVLSVTYCSEPYYLYGYSIWRVPLDQLVCEVSEKCPAGCRCVHRPSNATMHVYCSGNANITKLPSELPVLPKSYTKYKLDFSGAENLRSIEFRSYLQNTKILDLRNSGVEELDLAAWRGLAEINSVYLEGNSLKYLPKSVSSVNVTSQQLSLGNNPFVCSCGTRWMRSWLNSIRSSLTNTHDILCGSPKRNHGKNMIEIPEDDFCIDPVKQVLTVSVPTVIGIFGVLLSTVAIVYKLRVRLFKSFKFHPFDNDECAGEEMHYDVFLTCSSADNEAFSRHLLTRLEDHGYLVCYHLRDFVGGQAIDENIVQAVQFSKRTLCLLTENFLESAYCMREFEIALHHNITMKQKKRLVVLMMFSDASSILSFSRDSSSHSIGGLPVSDSLRQYLRQYTYIDYNAADWFDKLLYALPARGLLTQPNTVDQNRLQLRSDAGDVDSRTADDELLVCG